MARNPVQRSRTVPRKPGRTVTATTRKRRYAAVGLLVALLVGSWFEVEQHKATPSRSSLERTVEHIPVPGAGHPLRIDRWGSDLCTLHVSFAGWCPNDDILVTSGGAMSPDAYKVAWQDALTRTGWTKHAPDRAESPQEWWTRDRVAIVLLLRSDEARGPAFEWLDGQLLVEVHEVGNGMARLPG